MGRGPLSIISPVITSAASPPLQTARSGADGVVGMIRAVVRSLMSLS